ncbi:MAG: hypothetical protein V4629_03025 [Pseudomonadota bacterium]
MKIHVRRPNGILPKQSDYQLGDEWATIAQNLKMFRGRWESYKEPLLKKTLPKIGGPYRAIYLFGATPGQPDSGFWFHWISHVHVAKGPIPGDTQETTYFTGDGPPKYTNSAIATSGGTSYPTNSYLLGIVQPAATTTFVVTGATGDAENETERRYAITYVSASGEEGPPSLLTSAKSFWEGQTATLSNIPGNPVGNYNISTKRIYRTATGGRTDLYLAAQIPVSQTTYVDNLPDSGLGEIIPSIGWEKPPADMFGIGVLSNGIGYGFSKNQVCVSQPYQMHAWDPLTRVNTDYALVGGGHFSNTIVALTRKNPYLVTGYDPNSMTSEELNIGQACVSARSIVSSKYGVIYASPDGLISINGNGAENITKDFYTSEQWRALNPETMHGVMHEDRYYCFYSGGCLVIDPQYLDRGIVKVAVNADTAFKDPLTDRLYITQGQNLLIWDEGEPLLYLWTSKRFSFSRDVKLTAVKVYAQDYTGVKMKFYIDGDPFYTKLVLDRKSFRIPCKKTRDFQFLIESSSVVDEIMIAQTPSELI